MADASSDCRIRARTSRVVGACVAIGYLVTALGLGVSQEAPTGDPGKRLPDELAQNARYASSSACRDCHPDEHASWHRTFHRTMTQVATPETTAGRFDGTKIDSAGLLYRVFQRDGELWAEMPDPDVMMNRQATFDTRRARGLPVAPLHWRDMPRVERQVVMSTGSHHYQTYWVESARFPGTLMTLPLVYLIADQRWIPRESAFLYPPGPSRMVTVWNDHCIKCHSTGPKPAPFVEQDAATGKVARTGFRTEVGEIGISCEACHGPAAEHVRLRRAEVASRERGSAGAPTAEQLAADPIVHPGALADHERSSQVCGQCHGTYTRDVQQGLKFRDEGIDYFPGDDLHATRRYLFPPQEDADFYKSDAERRRAIAEYAQNRNLFAQMYWENGDVLAGGREYSGMAMSACYLRGEITCLSCHSMHSGEPNDMLRPDVTADEACQSCHDAPQYGERIAEHTHHAADSPGSSCVNCHMPRTTYALFGAIRTHRIASPDLEGSATHGVPNACNLCHLDKSLAWTAEQMESLWGATSPPLSPEQREVSAAVLWTLKGHAAQRAIAAWHFRWQPAHLASGNDWLAPHMAPLLVDPYGVVRYVAWKSLLALPGFEDLAYDFMGSREGLRTALAQVLDDWQRRQSQPPSRTGAAVLIGGDGMIDRARLQSLIDERDQRQVLVNE